MFEALLVMHRGLSPLKLHLLACLISYHLITRAGSFNSGLWMLVFKASTITVEAESAKVGAESGGV